MTHVRVSCNDAQYKRGFEELLVKEGLYAAWLGADNAPGPTVTVSFAGKMVQLYQRAYSAYQRIHVGDSFVLSGVTGFYVGRVLAGPEEEIVADNTGVGSSVRARVHRFARKSQQRAMAAHVAEAAAAGRVAEVYEVRFRVAWEKIVPTEEQIAWCKGVQGIFVHRTTPFPAAPALAVEEAPAPPPPAEGFTRCAECHRAIGGYVDHRRCFFEGKGGEGYESEADWVAASEAYTASLVVHEVGGAAAPAEDAEIAQLRAALAAAESELSQARLELVTLRRFRATVAAALPV